MIDSVMTAIDRETHDARRTDTGDGTEPKQSEPSDT